MATAATLARHLQAVGQANLDAILADYTEESVLCTQQGLITGLAGIHAFFDRFIGDAPPQLITALTILRQDVHGEVAYLVWAAEPFITLATDTFVVRGGKIVAQSFTMLAPV